MRYSHEILGHLVPHEPEVLGHLVLHEHEVLGHLVLHEPNGEVLRHLLVYDEHDSASRTETEDFRN